MLYWISPPSNFELVQQFPIYYTVEQTSGSHYLGDINMQIANSLNWKVLLRTTKKVSFRLNSKLLLFHLIVVNLFMTLDLEKNGKIFYCGYTSKINHKLNLQEVKILVFFIVRSCSRSLQMWFTRTCPSLATVELKKV